MTTYAIIGTGSAPKAAVTESLNDLLKDGDTVTMVWSGTPVPSSLATVYDYVLDNEIDFILYYTEGQKVPGDFREAAGQVTKVRNPLESQMADSPDAVLVLWDDDAEEMINKAFDMGATKVLELSNGLAPIVLADADDIPVPAPAPVEQDDDDDDTAFTREQLEDMAVAAVKRYGQRMGCEAKTKAGIIAELFGEDPVDDEPATEAPSATLTELPAPSAGTRNGDNSFEFEMVTLIGNFYEHYKPGFEADMAHLALGQARLWMLKMLSNS